MERRRKRKRPEEHAGTKSFKKAHATNDLKSEIRSLKRLLQRRDSMPATVRVEKERALQTAENALQKVERAKKRSEMIGRYHKIRFFERQKATRRLKRAKKALRACEEGDERRDELATAVDDAEVEINYAIYYPLDQHYVSLFPRKKRIDGDRAEEEEDDVEDGKEDIERQGDAEMWQMVRQCMAAGTLDDLRNGRLTQGDSSNSTITLPDPTQASVTRPAQISGATTGRREIEEEDDADSDGGFFE